MSKYLVTDPATNEKIATYPEALDSDIDRMIAAAHGAYESWSRSTSVSERALLLHRVADLFE